MGTAIRFSQSIFIRNKALRRTKIGWQSPFFTRTHFYHGLLGYGSRSFFKIGYLASEKDRLSLTISTRGANLQFPTTTEEWLVGRDSSRRTRETSAILRWQRTLFPRAMLSTSLYQRYASNRLIPTSDPVNPFARGSGAN